MATLGVNIDHVATVRQARGGQDPDPVAAAIIAELAGAEGITAHLREDRRHMQDRDIDLLRQTVRTSLNLEMAATPEMIRMALDVQPAMATLVPERREERTTEGGIEVRGREKELAASIASLREQNIAVSLFVNPDIHDIRAAVKTGATHVELHTGFYSNATGLARDEEFERLKDAALAAKKFGLIVNAGHGLDYNNVSPVAAIDGMGELNIGHSIISRAVLVGLDRAVRDMVKLVHLKA